MRVGVLIRMDNQLEERFLELKRNRDDVADLYAGMKHCLLTPWQSGYFLQ